MKNTISTYSCFNENQRKELQNIWKDFLNLPYADKIYHKEVKHYYRLNRDGFLSEKEKERYIKYLRNIYDIYKNNPDIAFDDYSITLAKYV